MSIRHLHHVLEPRSVAVFGASERPGSPGAALAANLFGGRFGGPIWPVNPKHATVLGRTCYRSAEALPEAPDLAFLAVPARAIPGILAALGARGTRVAILIGGSAPIEPAIGRAALAAAAPHGLRLIGPGSAGLVVPTVGLNASLGSAEARPGGLSLISQSGAIAATLVDWAADREIGFSHVASLGGMLDVDIGDYLDLLAGDRRSAAILFYLETIPAARKFMSAARAAARLKPVIAIKAGRHAAGAEAASLHTGAVTGACVVADAALRRAGVLRVLGLAELFEAAEMVGRFRPLARGRLGIVTNSGGAAVLAIDRLMDLGGELALLESGANPVDLGSAARPGHFADAVEAVAGDRSVDALLAVHCPTGLSEPVEVAEAVAGRVTGGLAKGKPVLSCWLGGARARAGRAVLRRAGVASYEAPAAAAAAVMHLTEWGRAQAALLRVPDRGDAELGTPAGARAKVAAIFGRVAEEGRQLLLEPEAHGVLASYGLDVVETRTAVTAEAVAAVALALLESEGAVAVKLLSRDVAHKGSVGGVILDRQDPKAAEDAARTIAARLAERRPGARLDGFLVQPMVRLSEGVEVIAGIGRDEVFGPVIAFGAGGVAVEALGDTAVALPPLDLSLAGELVGRTRIGGLLATRPEGDGAAARRALVALSHLIEDFPCIRGLDVNPLLVGGGRAVAIDARIEIEPGDIGRTGPNPDFAIRAYPAAWAKSVALPAGRFMIRAIRPSDAFLYPAFLERLDPEAIRRRFLAPRRHFPDEMGLRLTQLDYDRDMAFVAIAPDGSLAAVARLASAPNRECAEYALIVRNDLSGQGLGAALLAHLVDYARAEGLKRLEGSVLRENKQMLRLAARIGFTVAPDPDDPDLAATEIDL